MDCHGDPGKDDVVDILRKCGHFSWGDDNTLGDIWGYTDHCYCIRKSERTATASELQAQIEVMSKTIAAEKEKLAHAHIELKLQQATVAALEASVAAPHVLFGMNSDDYEQLLEHATSVGTEAGDAGVRK